MNAESEGCLDGSGMPLCEVLPWDTQFFKRKIARVSRPELTADDASRVRAWAAQHGVLTVYYLAEMEDIRSAQAAESVGFRVMDVRLTFQNSDLQRFEDQRVRVATRADLLSLEALASGSFSGTRFSQDPAFGPDNASRLYVEWLRKSIAGWAALTLVAESAETVLGFATCHLEARAGSIGLIAVDVAARGKGLGSALVMSAISKLRDAGASSVSVVTQGANLYAQRLYRRAGFAIGRVQIWFHLTLGDA